MSSGGVASPEFYATLLGFEVVLDQAWIVTTLSLDDPHSQIRIISRDATAAVHADISIEVDDVDTAHAEAVRRGAEIVRPLTDEPWGVRRFFVRGPTGTVINVLSHGS